MRLRVTSYLYPGSLEREDSWRPAGSLLLPPFYLVRDPGMSPTLLYLYCTIIQCLFDWKSNLFAKSSKSMALFFLPRKNVNLGLQSVSLEGSPGAVGGTWDMTGFCPFVSVGTLKQSSTHRGCTSVSSSVVALISHSFLESSLCLWPQSSGSRHLAGPPFWCCIDKTTNWLCCIFHCSNTWIRLRVDSA